MARRPRSKSDVVRVVRAFMRRQYGAYERRELLLQLLNEEAVSRFLGGRTAPQVDEGMASEFKINTEQAVRSALSKAISK